MPSRAVQDKALMPTATMRAWLERLITSLLLILVAFTLKDWYVLFFLIFIYLFVAALGLIAARGLSLVMANGATLSYCVQASRCDCFSCCRAQVLGTWASVVVVHRFGCPMPCGFFPDQGWNQCPLN